MEFAVRRIINGIEVADEDVSNFIIENNHIIEILYRAQKRIISQKIIPNVRG